MQFKSNTGKVYTLVECKYNEKLFQIDYHFTIESNEVMGVIMNSEECNEMFEDWED